MTRSGLLCLRFDYTFRPSPQRRASLFSPALCAQRNIAPVKKGPLVSLRFWLQENWGKLQGCWKLCDFVNGFRDLKGFAYGERLKENEVHT